MSQPGHRCCRPDDEALLTRLATALAETDAAPPYLEPAARELLSWRTVDADLDEVLRNGCAHAPATD
jgi:hypothetical protein